MQVADAPQVLAGSRRGGAGAEVADREGSRREAGLSSANDPEERGDGIWHRKIPKWAKVKSNEVGRGIDIKDGNLMFPSWDSNNLDKFITVQPDDKCKRQITLDFKVNFAVLASDSGNTVKFLNLAGSLIDMGKDGISPLTVITAAGKVIQTIGEALDHEDVNGHQEFHFPVRLCCPQQFQPFNVSLEVDTRLLISWDSPNDSLSLDMHLRAHTGSADKSRVLTGDKGGTVPHDYKETLSVGFVTDGDFEVVVWFNERCNVKWGPGKPSISLVRFDHLRIIIETSADCKEGKAPPFVLIPPSEDSGTIKPESSKTSKSAE
jgi:hypothetical protein